MVIGSPHPGYVSKVLMEVCNENAHTGLLVAAILTSGAITSVQAEDMFYIVYDKTMHGCTIVTTEPSDKSRYKTEGRNKTESEAERAITSIKECEWLLKPLRARGTKPGIGIAPLISKVISEAA